VTRCPKCGKESPDQARFCRFCGGKLSVGIEAAASADSELTPEQRAQRLLEEAFRLSEQGRILAAIQTCQQAILLTPQSTSAHSCSARCTSARAIARRRFASTSRSSPSAPRAPSSAAG